MTAMNRIVPIPVLITVAALLAGCADAVGPGPITELPRSLTTAEREVIAGSNLFSFDLLRESVSENPDSPNVFLSPLSASMALGMTMNGTDGETWAQMRDVLGFERLEEEEINESYRALIDLLLDLDRRVTFGLGNSIWTRDGYPILPDFYDRARTYFDAEVTELDFLDPGAKDVINGWVEDVTAGRITEMIERIPPDAVMFLINAVYFKGSWSSQFDPDNTTTAPFTLADGGTVSVPLMRQTAEFARFQTATARGVELPYGGGAFTAVAVQPRGDGTLGDLVRGLDRVVWAEWMAQLEDEPAGEVAVLLPRFEIEYEQVLDGTLQSLGMTDMFNAELADFSRLVQGGGVWVDEVKQKTFLKVDEEGTEAAAATSVRVIESAPPELRFDAPFLFAIRERLSGTILFIGVIGDPTA